MGQRANLVLVREEGFDLYYTHWAANTLPNDLFWGPSHAVRFIEAQRGREQGAEWLDEVWAEGGAVLDPGRRVLLLYGGEDVLHDVPRRRVHLELMRERWSGWDLGWAHEGIADLAEYVGVPRETGLVPSDAVEPDWTYELTPPKDRSWTSAVVSVLDGVGQLRLLPTDDRLEDAVTDPRFLPKALSAAGPDRCDLGDWTSSFPGSGAHVDVRRRRLELWNAPDKPDVIARATRALPEGWTFAWHRDRFEAQLESTDGALAFPAFDDAELVDRCRRSLLTPHRPIDVLGIMGRVAGEGSKVEVNPYALRDDRPAVDPDSLARLFEEAVAARVSRWIRG